GDANAGADTGEGPRAPGQGLDRAGRDDPARYGNARDPLTIRQLRRRITERSAQQGIAHDGRASEGDRGKLGSAKRDADLGLRAAGPGNRNPEVAVCESHRNAGKTRSEEHTSELQSLTNLVCR